MLQRRLGNAGVSSLLGGHDRPAGPAAIAASAAAPVVMRSPAGRLVTLPTDPAEREAETVAKRVMAMPETHAEPPRLAHATAGGAAGLARAAASATGAPEIDPQTAQEIEASAGGGMRLPESIRIFMGRRFRADFSGVRIHTDERAGRLAARVSARAFAYRHSIYFARGAYNPNTRAGAELIAHELTHTIQQRAVVQRAGVQREAAAPVVERAPARVQRFSIGDIPGFLADRANAVPGFRMFTIVLGVNPITMAPVERSAANVLRAVVEFLPGGVLITQALDAYGIFDRVGGFIDQQLRGLGITGAAIGQAVKRFIDSLSLGDIFEPVDVWNRAVAIFTVPISRIKEFVANLAGQVLDFIRDAILRPLANLAAGTRGWDLLIAVLGRNPITGEAVPRNAETLIGGFMKLIDQEEVWENLKKSNAVPRAWAWFQGAMAAVLAFVGQLPSLFLNALRTLGIADLAALPSAFARVAGVFGNFVGQFIGWAGGAVWNLLEIIFEVVSPRALEYIKKTGAALKSILRNPLPFVANLVKAAKLGFENFATNFGTHLKTGLIEWLTGSLPGIYIPKAFSLVEIGRFVLSILGITWAQIRGKIVKALGPTGERIMSALETTFDIVVALVKGGAAAAWELIKEKLSDLKDTVIGGIIGFITDVVVKKAIPKLISLFIPGAGFISAILSIYDTIKVFIEKLAKIAQVVVGFIDSIVAIAGGAIGVAATRVENTFAGLISLAISFFAGFAGLGNIADKVLEVVKKVYVAVDKALEAAIAWIIGKAKALFGRLFGKDGQDKLDPEKEKKIDAGIKALRAQESRHLKEGKLSFVDAKQIASIIKNTNTVFQSFDAFEIGTHVKYRYAASPAIVIEGPEELPKYDVESKDIEAPPTKPSKDYWDMKIIVAVTDSKGKHQHDWVFITVPMDNELGIPRQPPSPSMIIEGRVSIEGKMQQLRLSGGSITEYSLKLLIGRYQARFGDLGEIHGSLAADNKSLYQLAYAELRSNNVDEDTARDQAILRTPFGKYRAQLGYDKFTITLRSFDWAIIPKLDPDRKKRFFVPTSIDVIARR
jgi:hypothetical protein